MKVKDILFLVIIFSIVCGFAIINMYKSKNHSLDKIVAVHIKGEIKNPGYYELEYGSRLKDVIEAAGGETDNADLGKVNLAVRLRDGEEIIIPDKNSQEEGEKVNINTADSYTLTTLDSVGETLAESIVSYREKNGSFGSIEDIKKVNGINDSTYEKIKDYIIAG